MFTRLVIASLLLSSLGLVACGTREAERNDAPAEREVEPRQGGTLRIAITRDPGSLSVVNRRGAESNRLFAVLQPGLMRRDVDGTYRPGLLKSWEWSEDGLRLDGTLDAELRWSDGAPFVADDIVATFDLLRDERVGYVGRSYLEPVDTVEALAPDRVRFTLTARGVEPARPILHDILPAHVIAQLDRGDPGAWPLSRSPVTLGRYRLAEWTPNERIRLERNPHHPRPGHLDAIELVVVPEPMNALIRLELGEVDVIPSIPLLELERIREEGKIDIEMVAGRLSSMLFLNLSDEIVSDPAVRRAIDHAIDRRALAEGPLFGTAAAARGFLPPASWAFDAQRAAPSQNLEAARAELDAAGWRRVGDGPRTKDGRSLRLHLLAAANTPDREAVASLLRAQLEAVGFEIELQTAEVGAAVQAMKQGEAQAFYVRLNSPTGVEFHPFFESGAGQNLSHYASDEFDALSRRIVEENDPERARALVAQAEDMLRRDLPVVMLLNPQRVLGFSRRVHGETPNFQSYYDGADTWWVDGDGTGH